MTSLVGQAIVNVAAALGAIAGPLIIGALTRKDPSDGWRKFYVRRILLEGCSLYMNAEFNLVDTDGTLGSVRGRDIRCIQAT